jgi:hypothetical protein
MNLSFIHLSLTCPPGLRIKFYWVHWKKDNFFKGSDQKKRPAGIEQVSFFDMHSSAAVMLVQNRQWF